MTKTFQRTKSQGFTLVEIMIVVAIIIVLAAIAIPNLVRSRLTANEAAAIASLKTITWAAITYRTSNSGYPADIAQLGAGVPSYIDSVLSTGTKQGYIFNVTGGSGNFNVTAQPVAENITGTRSFYSDASAVIRASTGSPADGSSPPIE
ncbi:MAG: prepilin-type N-terminal cleavage/methylation domain-containing protein [Candidatus Omnitrophota bacterium]